MSESAVYKPYTWLTSNRPFAQRLRQLACLLLLVAFLSFPTTKLTAQNEPPPVTLEIYPKTLTLRGQTAYPVIAVARNTSGQSVTDLSLTARTNLPIQLSHQLEQVAELLPGAEKAWHFTIAAQDNDPLAGLLLFELVYGAAPEEGRAGVNRLVINELTITAPTKPATEEVASLTVVAPSGSMNERRDKPIHLVVANKGQFPITVSGIQVETPHFIQATEWTADFPLTLAPGQQESLSLTLSTGNQVEPGKVVVLFQGAFSWNEQGQPYQGVIVTVQEIEVGVMGESQLLALLGIPTLLFLPGFVILLTFLTFQAYGQGKEEKEKLLKVGSVEFWFFAILLSLIASFLYPSVTRILLGGRRDFLGAYGFIDVVYLVVGSFTMGLLAFLTARMIFRLYNWYIAQTTPHELDSPTDTLQKIARTYETLQLPRVRVKIDDDSNFLGFIVQAQDAQANAYWVAPEIRIPLTPESGAQVYAILNADKPDIAQLLSLFEPDQLRWADGWPYPGPKVLASDKLEFLNEKTNLVVID